MDIAAVSCWSGGTGSNLGDNAGPNSRWFGTSICCLLAVSPRIEWADYIFAIADLASALPVANFPGVSGVMVLAAICWLALVNAWTVLRFWQDKVRAVEGRRRIPEADLLGLALIGGTPGAYIARHRFRHKTRKEPFSTRLMVIAAGQVGFTGAYLFL